MKAKLKKKISSLSSLHGACTPTPVASPLFTGHWLNLPTSSRREAKTEPYQNDILPDQAGQIKLQSPNTTLVAAMKTEWMVRQRDYDLVARIATAVEVCWRQHSRFVSISLLALWIFHAPIPAASSSRSFGSLTWHSSIPAPTAEPCGKCKPASNNLWTWI